MPSTRSQTAVLVTGASAGIGQAFADRLARAGHTVVAVARRADRLEALAQRLHDRDGVPVEVVVADLTQPDDLRRVEQRAAGEDIELLVNNAGFGGYMPFVQLPPQQAEQLVDLHVLAPTRLTRAALPGMLARGRGAIINVASLLAFSGPMPTPPLPARATYAGCKSYLVTFSEVLHGELAGTGVQVQVLCPGVVQTEFHQVMGMDMSGRGVPMMQPEAVVEASLAGLRDGEVICVPSLRDRTPIDQLRQAQTRLFEIARPGGSAGAP